MINQYGADAVRWFILSDSPPEKDIQWSDTGVVSANKFLQKIWNLNLFICNRKDIDSVDEQLETKFKSEINNFIFKIDSSIKGFRFNVAIANFYEMYNFSKDFIDKKISNKILKENLIKLMKLMVPFIPHLANECLELLKVKSCTDWPKPDKEGYLEEVKVAIQVNGKTRDVLVFKKDLSEKEINKIILSTSKAKKYIENSKILKTIFVKNKIINYITSK